MAEVKRTYYESGELLSEVFEINGKKNGEYKRYNELGMLIKTSMYDNGELKEIYNYVNGIKQS